MWMMAQRCCARGAGQSSKRDVLFSPRAAEKKSRGRRERASEYATMLQPYGDRDAAAIRAYVRSGGRPRAPPPASPLSPFIVKCFRLRPHERPPLDLLHNDIANLRRPPETKSPPSRLGTIRESPSGRPKSCPSRVPSPTHSVLMKAIEAASSSQAAFVASPDGDDAEDESETARRAVVEAVEVVAPPGLSTPLSHRDHLIAPEHLSKMADTWVRQAKLCRTGSILLQYDIPHTVDRGRVDTPTLALEIQSPRRSSLVTAKLERLLPSPSATRNAHRRLHFARRLAARRLRSFHMWARRKLLRNAWARWRRRARARGWTRSASKRASARIARQEAIETKASSSSALALRASAGRAKKAQSLALRTSAERAKIDLFPYSFVATSGVPCERDIATRYARRVREKYRAYASREAGLPPGLDIPGAPRRTPRGGRARCGVYSVTPAIDRRHRSRGSAGTTSPDAPPGETGTSLDPRALFA